MNDISPVSHPNPTALNGVQRNGRQGAEHKSPSRGNDRVELSQAAQDLSKNNAVSDIRHDLVSQIRSQIEAGTYETPQKIDAALDALSQDLV